ncbi:NAD-dependent epimerase/dehydratase family protein [Pedobacter glucosidilyticus]|uniref:NAD-dependent epimerase/dehydratase family protein n=1 Tax=Pedobacter glucosidilyticus TaxID=1122941 RepID=UPI0003F9CD5E|nr:NAD(P)-dependent oxidoreductase [Pedobacter glucosidilyticus]
MPDFKKKILVLGGNGFVGKNIALNLIKDFDVVTSSRKQEPIGNIYFDLSKKETWLNITQLDADIIINCIGYGVVKEEQDIKEVFDTNYINTIAFYEYLRLKSPNIFIIHIGTAFEYDLTQKKLHENSTNTPLTHYGMSKFLASNYLLHKFTSNNYLILRPFSMFGSFEDISKIIPALILAQKEKRELKLSNGLQKRDYFHIIDLANFINNLLKKTDLNTLPKCINIGTGSSISIKEIAEYLAPQLPSFQTSFWKWGVLAYREGETEEFFNASITGKKLGFEASDLKTKLKETISYYWNL